MTKYACLITFGCQMNVYDSGRLSDLLKSAGYEMTDDKEKADFLFFNTCSIREKAAQKVLNHLGQLKSLKKARPELIIGVGGCVAEQEGARLLEQAPWVSLVAGPQRLPEIPALLARLEASPEPAVLVGAAAGPAFGRDNLARLGYPALAEAAPEATRPINGFVTVMQGCDNFCAYCVVPYLRGREMSRAPEDVKAEVESLIAGGARDITLLGQNVNSYRPAGGAGFPELLEELAALPGLWRLRFTTSHPKDFPDRLIELFGRPGPLCEQLHLPVQSGSDAVLAAMGRRYGRAGYLALVDKLRQSRPDLALSTDVIVGFPGESEADFEDTLSLVEQVGYDSMFSFKYSDRPRTKALGLPGKVPEESKARRLGVLQALQKKITLAKNRAHIGQRLEVLVEGPSGRKTGQMSGRARNFKIVNFDGPPELAGRLVTVEIESAGPASLVGRRAGPGPIAEGPPCPPHRIGRVNS